MNLNRKFIFVFKVFVLVGVWNLDAFSMFDRGEYQTLIGNWLDQVNADYMNFNQISANLSWEQTVNPSKQNVELINKLAYSKVNWINNICRTAINEIDKNLLTTNQNRQIYLLCRGANYTIPEIQNLIALQSTMYGLYVSTDVCLANSTCYKGEPDLENIMASPSSDKETLLWAWDQWHTIVGSKIGKYYPKFVSVLNAGAQRQQYADIGEVWREEIELDNLGEEVLRLYASIEDLYVQLHAVIRYALWKKYGEGEIDPKGLIPEHLLGNMWGQDWGSLISSLIGEKKFDLDGNIQGKLWSAKEMVAKAEDFYTSMGFPEMTNKFWKNSRFESHGNKSACHGTAADMFTGDDFRILMCVEPNLNDFYVIHHEMGHIQYYMSYADKIPLFQEGANSGFQESIGDSIMLGVMSPFHLHRLGLITDEELMSDDYNLILLLYQALTKIPQIPYALMIDYYRWNIFNGNIAPSDYNKAYWAMTASIRGIKPANHSRQHNSHLFDAGAKFHIADNTPYIRYFLSYIIQFQLFKGMCDVSIYGEPINENQGWNKEIPFLNRCDIYGSKFAGKKLMEFMSYGASKHWSKILPIITKSNTISTKPLLIYFDEVSQWLRHQILKHNIPVGW